MKFTTKTIIIGVIGLVVLAVGLTLFAKSQPGKYDGLATFLSEKGVKFYGAFWCPHCQRQKEMFGNSARLLPYVECSTPDGQGQTQICIDNKITGYPTWVFPDGSRISGETSPEDLAAKIGYTFPK